MSKKVLTSMKDENPELQKQIGCISGFFQLFDRHRFLTGQQRSSSSHNQNIVAATKGGISNHIKEVNDTTQKATANNVKVARENQQSSTESSGTSMSSSSRSSSMSSLEFNRTIQIEQSLPPPPSSISSQMKVPENSNNSGKGLDFYDIVKESMQRDVHGLSAVKTAAAKEEKKGRILKHIDSPRPPPPSKSAWDSPRLSYDGRDRFKSAAKTKELPRLSLDSKQGSINEGTTQPRTMLEPEASRRSSSVVARLMGLETCDTPADDEYKKTMKGSSALHQFRRDASIMNVTTPHSRFSQEPIPWRSESSSTKASNLSLSVYGEIEKRVAELEFKNSGKDLRALKQILDAMQRYKESFDVTTRDQVSSNSLSDNRSNSSLSESSMVKSPRIRQKDPSHSTQGGSKSQIFIMKSAKAARKNDSTAKDVGPAIRHAKDDKSKKTSTSKLMQSSKVRQVIINGENASNTTEARSPRLQKKFGLERRSPSNSSSGSNRRQNNNRPSVELSSPSTTPRQKFSEISNQRRNFKHEVGVEVIHVDHYSDRINGNSIQLKGMNQNNDAEVLSKESFMAEKTITAEQPSPVSVLDASFYREEPPSPVKKKSDISKDLDDDALNSYESSEESSEDLLLSSNTAKANFSSGISDTDLRTQNLVQIDYNDERFTNFRDDKDPDHKYISEILLASGLLSSTSSCQVFHSSSFPINPKLFLALEQIKTNKMCFNIEHNAKKIVGLSSPELMQRKLIFDVVSDILAQKIVLESSTFWCKPNQSAGRKLRGKLLLDELCTEIDKLQHKNRNVNLADEDENLTSLLWEELMQCPTIYTKSYSEIPNVVLDIERLIFKDLITEVVRSELANQSGKHCRQLLFSK